MAGMRSWGQRASTLYTGGISALRHSTSRTRLACETPLRATHCMPTRVSFRQQWRSLTSPRPSQSRAPPCALQRQPPCLASRWGPAPLPLKLPSRPGP